MYHKTMKTTAFSIFIALLIGIMILMTGCGRPKSTAGPETKSTEETSQANGQVFEIGGMQIGIPNPNAERPADAPEGGDGKTALTDEELKARQVEIADSGNRKNMTYADFVEALDGVEKYWKYTWYSSTGNTWLEVVFTVETGLYNSDTFYQ